MKNNKISFPMGIPCLFLDGLGAPVSQQVKRWLSDLAVPGSSRG